MTKRRVADINIGLRRIGRRIDPGYPSEAEYVQNMREQSKAMTDALLGVLQDFVDASPQICYDALIPTKQLAEYYCPKDTHRLVNSAYLEITSFRGKPRVELGFARGGKPFYAAYVHENLAMQHKAPTTAKFLERALKEDLQGIQERIATGYAKLMHGGG